jgi:hypothetical protein
MLGSSALHIAAPALTTYYRNWTPNPKPNLAYVRQREQIVSGLFDPPIAGIIFTLCYNINRLHSPTDYKHVNFP